MPIEAEDQGPPPLSRIRSRDRRVMVTLASILGVVALATWLTIPSDATLLERARAHPDQETRIEALNALVLRGYWDQRPTRELVQFLADQPEQVQRFVREMHPTMLNSQRDALLPAAADTAEGR